MIKRFPVTGYFVMSQQWKCNIFNSKSYFKNSIKIVFESLLEGFWLEITKYFKTYFAMLYFFVIYLLWREKITMEYVLLFCNVVFFCYLLIMASKKNLLWNMFQSFLTFTVKKEKTQRFYVIKYVKLKIYFLF